MQLLLNKLNITKSNDTEKSDYNYKYDDQNKKNKAPKQASGLLLTSLLQFY